MSIDKINLVDQLQVALEKINLVRMASHALDREQMNAIATACFEAVQIVEGVQEELESNVQAEPQRMTGGERGA